MKKRVVIGLIGFGTIGRAIHHGFQHTTDFRIYDKNPKISENTLEEVCKESDYVFIGVPTPMNIDTGIQDTSIIESVIDECSRISNKPIYIIKSTLVPGTTKQLQDKYPEIHLVFNPEFLTERSYKLDFINASRIIISGNIKDTTKVKELYRMRFPEGSVPIYLTDTTTAETVKCLANCFLASKVAICNEYYQICEALHIDYNEVINLILADGRIGRSHTDVPGHDGKLGFGGLCFCKDLNATINKAKELGVKPTIMEAVWKKNLELRPERDWEQIEWVISK